MNGWDIRQYDGVDHIEKTFLFKKYSRALAFCNAVACLAESHVHHPRIVIEWGLVTVAWGTHQSDQGSGVMTIDQALAGRSDVLYEQINLNL